MRAITIFGRPLKEIFKKWYGYESRYGVRARKFLNLIVPNGPIPRKEACNRKAFLKSTVPALDQLFDS